MRTFFLFRLFLVLIMVVGVSRYAHAFKPMHEANSAIKDYGFDERFFDFSASTQISDASNGALPVSSQSIPHNQQAIQSRYRPAFAKLQQDLDSHIIQMKQAAWVDYDNNKRTGSPSIAEIVIKYATVGNRLQAGADKAFYRLHAQMKHDLQTAGLSMDLANQTEREYKAQTQQKRAELISKGKAKL